MIGAKARAILSGRHVAQIDDVLHVAHAVLGHRIMPNFAAEADRVTTDQVIDQLLKAVA